MGCLFFLAFFFGQAYKAMLAQLKWFAGTPIRNVAAIGGNVANASPISDLNPVLMACKVPHLYPKPYTQTLSPKPLNPKPLNLHP